MPRSLPCRILCALALALLSPLTSYAGTFDPLPTYNQSPLAQIYGLPAFDAPRVLPRNRVQARISFEATSHFSSHGNGAETLVLDGETHRTAVSVKYGTGAAEWGIEVPYVSHGGGFLDSFIEGWHDAFGLRQGGRDAAARDRLTYVYRRGGAERLRLTDATSGIGDVRLLAGWPLAPRGDLRAALRVSLKLPTGDAGELHGSGAPDASLWVTAGCARCARAWGWNATAGILALGRGDVLPELQRRFGVFGGAGAGWRPWRSVVLKTELRAHTPLYRDTRLAPLGQTVVQLVLGGSWDISPRNTLDVGISEDLRAGTASDVSFLVSLGSVF